MDPYFDLDRPRREGVNWRLILSLTLTLLTANIPSVLADNSKGSSALADNSKGSSALAQDSKGSSALADNNKGSSAPAADEKSPDAAPKRYHRKIRSAAQSAAASADKKTPAAETASAPPAPTVPEAPSETARIDSVRHRVDVKTAKGEWQHATNRMTLQTSDKLRTGDRSIARLKLKDGSKVLLLQNSEAELEGLTSIQKTIRLLKGRVRAIVTHLRGGNQFKIKTPVGVASVRGTDFEVEFSEDKGEMQVDVLNGQVGVAKLGDLASEVIVNPGERLRFGADGELRDPIRSGALPVTRPDVRAEVQNTRVRDAIVSQAAEESRNADYQIAKSLIDVDGRRVRVEEYIKRDRINSPDEMKMVVLNKRPSSFNYFVYDAKFNKALPDDLSVALKDVGGKLGLTAPDYFISFYKKTMSNTVDNVTDQASNGHLVQVAFDGTNYTLTDPTDPTNTRTIQAAALQSDGTYKIYNPLTDTFSAQTAANATAATTIAMLDRTTGAYRDVTAGDTLWKTRFNNYALSVDSLSKSMYAKKSSVTNTLAIDLDANWSFGADGTQGILGTTTEFPAGTDNLYQRSTVRWTDGTKLVYDNYIIDDAGTIAPASRFSSITTGADYKNELEKWNYQTKVSGDGMKGEINLVVDPRIGTQSGLIQ